MDGIIAIVMPLGPAMLPQEPAYSRRAHPRIAKSAASWPRPRTIRAAAPTSRSRHAWRNTRAPAPGAIKKKCHDVRRKIEDELGVVPYDHIHAMCGPDFYDDLITHPEVEKAYERWLDDTFPRQGQARGSFEYAGIVFEEDGGRYSRLHRREQGVLLPRSRAGAVPSVQRAG